MTNAQDLFEDEEEAKKQENFSEPDGLVKSVNGNVELIDENTIEAQEMHKGVGDTDPKGTAGFHIEDENGKDQE